MKKNKRNFKRSLQVLISSLFIIPALISCVMPEDSTKDNSESKKAELEAKRLQKKMEIYNKMLGNWESESEYYISNYYNYSYGTETEILHIEPMKWWYSKENHEDKTFMEWPQPFYNYIYLYDEYMDEDFFESKIVKNRKYLNSNYLNEDVIFLKIDKFVDRNNPKNFFKIQALPEKLNADGINLKRCKTSGNDNNDDDDLGGGSGENIDLSGFWNYEVPGQSNAGGTITFANGVIRFQQKVGSTTTEASYTLSGDEITISNGYSSEKFKITKLNNTLTFTYKGSGEYSYILMTFFHYMGTDKKITLTKN